MPTATVAAAAAAAAVEITGKPTKDLLPGGHVQFFAARFTTICVPTFRLLKGEWSGSPIVPLRIIDSL